MGLHFDQLDIHVSGASHDLLNADRQAELEARIAGGEFDFLILSPLCGNWSRLDYCTPTNHARSLAGARSSLGESSTQARRNAREPSREMLL